MPKEQTTVHKDAQLVMVKQFKPDTWELDMPRELWIDKMATVGDFASLLSKSYDIPIDQVMVTKVNSPWSFHRVLLPFSEWVLLSDPKSSTSYLHSAPFYLSTDGILFIVRDGTQDIRDMTQQEKDMYHCDEFENQMFVQGTSGSKKAYRPEAGVKITVKVK